MTEIPAVPATLPRLSLVLVCSLTLACGSGESQAPETPDVRGTYAGTWDLVMESADVSGRWEASCEGTFTVDSQTDSTFEGSFRIDSVGQSSGELSCSVVEGRIANGQIGASALVSFVLLSGESGAAATLSGCRGRDLWQGEFVSPSTGEIQLDAGVRFTMSCPAESGGERPFTSGFQFRGTRQ